eukprot:13947331-Alexandrium_andersonii.AAC.1
MKASKQASGHAYRRVSHVLSVEPALGVPPANSRTQPPPDPTRTKRTGTRKQPPDNAKSPTGRRTKPDTTNTGHS